MSSAGSIGGNSTDFPQAAATDPSRKQRSSSVWQSRYRDALAMIVRSSAAFGRHAGIACGTSVRYDQSRPSNAPSRGRRRDQRPAAQHHQVVPVDAVEAASTVIACGTVRLDSVSPGSRLSACGERIVTLGHVAQRGDQPVGADRRLEHQRDRAPGRDQSLGDGLQPDGRAVDQVQVDVTVDQRAWSGSGQWVSLRSWELNTLGDDREQPQPVAAPVCGRRAAWG